MSRSLRLNRLLQLLRRHRRPVRGQLLADTLGISLRTLYRDIATLQQQGADLRGEAGIGYVLQPGDTLPPLTLPPEEIGALVLGLGWVASRTGPALAEAARDALARIGHALPAERRLQLQTSGLRVGPARPLEAAVAASLQVVREAIGSQRRVDIDYRDLAGHRSERTVWPFALAYFDEVPMLAAWCELRGGFRHFRLDRIDSAQSQDKRYPTARSTLLRRWQREQGITPDWRDRC